MGVVSTTVVVKNRLGMHARPAMAFVDAASGFASEIKVAKAEQVVDGKSIMQLMMLAATQGTQLKITADGPDAEEAVNQLGQLVDREFDED